jgi:hypothetical protein
LQVAAAFKTKPATVLQALRSTTASSNTASLEGPSYVGPASAKGEEQNVPWAALLTSTDLDDEEDDGPGNAPNTGVAGHGSFFAAAGKVPGWMQQAHQQDSSSSSGSGTSSGSAVAGAPMQTLLHTHSDVELETEQQVQQLMRVLSDRERGIIQMLYGNDAAGLLQAAEASSSSSSSSDAKAGWQSRSSFWATAATSAKATTKTASGQRTAFIKGGVPLAVVAERYGLTIERTRQLRLAALQKLQAAAAAGGMLDASADASGAAAAAAAVAEQKADSLPASDAVAAVEAAIQACAAPTRPLLQALQSYYARHDSVPPRGLKVESRNLGVWCARQRKLFQQGRLSEQLLAALQLVAPGWLPDTASAQQQQQQQQQPDVGRNWRNLQQQESGLSQQGQNPAAEQQQQQQLTTWPRHLSVVPVAGDAVVAELGCPPAGGAEAAVEAAIRACVRRPRPLLLLRRYYAQLGSVPPANGLRIAGCKLGDWCARQLSLYEQGKLSEQMLAALELAAPGWLPDTATAQQEQQQQQQPYVGGRKLPQASGQPQQGQHPAAKQQQQQQQQPITRWKHVAGAGSVPSAGDAAAAVVELGCSSAASAEAAEVEAAIRACAPRCRPLLQGLKAFYAEHGSAPPKGLVVDSMHLGDWCARQLSLFEQHELSEQLLAALQLVAPGWLPGSSSSSSGSL